MTQTQIIELVQQHHPEMGETQIRLYLNRALDEFCRKTRILKTLYTFSTVADKTLHTAVSYALFWIIVNSNPTFEAAGNVTTKAPALDGGVNSIVFPESASCKVALAVRFLIPPLVPPK